MWKVYHHIIQNCVFIMYIYIYVHIIVDEYLEISTFYNYYKDIYVPNKKTTYLSEKKTSKVSFNIFTPTWSGSLWSKAVACEWTMIQVGGRWTDPRTGLFGGGRKNTPNERYWEM